MLSRVSSPKDFWAGLIYVGFGVAALWIGADYKFGTASRMGPGYFPKVLASLLILIGLISLARGFVASGTRVSEVLWRPLLLISAAIALYGYLLPRAGVVVALLVLCLTSAAASREFRFDWKASAGLVLLIVFCVLVFVKGLGVPMPVTGSWLQPYISIPWLL